VNPDLALILVRDFQIPENQLRPDVTLQEVRLDSLAFVELAIRLKSNFGIEVTEAELEDAGTLGQLDLLVEQKRNES
jgi:acyl carrier protein